MAADARLLTLKTTTFGCEEGSLTGESVAVFKSTDPVAADSTIAVSRARNRQALLWFVEGLVCFRAFGAPASARTS